MRTHRHRPGIRVKHRIDGADRAAERPVGISGGACLDRQPLADRRQHRLRHGEIELDRGEVADRGDLCALAGDRADRDVAERDPAGEGRADDPVADLRLDLLRLRARGGGGGDLGIIARAGGEAAILELGNAQELLIGFAGAGIGLAELRVLLGLAEHGDNLPLPYEGAVIEVQAHDPLGDRRGEGDLLVRPGGADRLDPVDELHRRRRLRLHQRRLPRAAALLGVTAAASRDQNREKRNDELPGHALLSKSCRAGQCAYLAACREGVCVKLSQLARHSWRRSGTQHCPPGQ